MSSLVLTGAGLITGLGAGREANWTGLCAGATGLGEIKGFSVSEHAATRGGEAPPRAGLPVDRRDRAHALLEAACLEALQESLQESLGDDFAGPWVAPVAPARAALVLGSSLAAQASAPRFWESYIERGPQAASLDDLRCYDVEPRISRLAARFGIEGESLLVSNACAAGASALAIAADLIRLGRADWALVAGYDAIDLHTHAGFGAIRALDPGGPRPFSATREGMLLGDGFAALVLERADLAAAGGRRARARVLGYGESADAHHLTQPHPEGAGAALAMRRALTQAGLEPSAVDAINVHSTATPTNDAAEVAAMRAVFGERLASLPLSASKPAFGHTLGGAGAVEAVVALSCIEAQTLPGTLGDPESDPALGPLSVPRATCALPLRVVMSNSFGFGGCNTSLLLGAP